MGPKRDLTGDLAKAVRKENLICGLSSHRMERDAFAFPGRGVSNDQFDPRYAGFYGPPIQGTFNNSNVSHACQADWLARVQKPVDKCCQGRALRHRLPLAQAGGTDDLAFNRSGKSETRHTPPQFRPDEV
jgi:alpha-L-fucosidase